VNESQPRHAAEIQRQKTRKRQIAGDVYEPFSEPNLGGSLAPIPESSHERFPADTPALGLEGASIRVEAFSRGSIHDGHVVRTDDQKTHRYRSEANPVITVRD